MVVDMVIDNVNNLNNVVITIREDGNIIYMPNESTSCFEELGVINSKRASHVEPDNFPLRILFHMLRCIYGDKGRMSEFTRHWPCLWRVNTKPTVGVILPERWRNREDAIAAEIAFLNDYLI